MPCGQATSLATVVPYIFLKMGNLWPIFVQLVRQSGMAEGAGVQIASDDQRDDAGGFDWKFQLYSLAGLDWLQ